MSSRFKFQGFRFKIRGSGFGVRVFKLFCLLPFAFCLFSCGSVPNLDPPECAAAGQTIKEFYSIHFGGDLRFSRENLKLLEKFLTPEYDKNLQTVETDGDLFTTGNTDFPKAFRIGKCEVVSPEKIRNEILLFWRDNARSEQKSIYVEVVKQNGQWLINQVEPLNK